MTAGAGLHHLPDLSDQGLEPPETAAADATDPSERPRGGGVDAALRLSGLRCTLAYVVLPVLVPVLGFRAGAVSPLLFALHLLAMYFSARAMRRCIETRRTGGAVVAGALLTVNVLSFLA